MGRFGGPANGQQQRVTQSIALKPLLRQFGRPSRQQPFVELLVDDQYHSGSFSVDVQ
jgi:hypothetical protein